MNILGRSIPHIIIISVLALLANDVLTVSTEISLSSILGLHSIYSQQFHFYQLLTYMFMHGGYMHLFFNMFALWMFGLPLELRLGMRRFAYYFLISGIGAALIHLGVLAYQHHKLITDLKTFVSEPTPEHLKKLAEKIPIFNPEAIVEYESLWNSGQMPKQYLESFVTSVVHAVERYIDIPTVGASGAVFAILLAFGVLYPNATILLFFFIPIKAKYFVILYGIVELWLGLTNLPNDPIAHFAHLGGMIWGGILLYYWKRKGVI
ncbi:MAG: rhomboid family intramembrane serine protease [Chlorobi bacterium]|nr:rhomboid family intramembrane serine protease [Chlorobiota bacterium]